MSAPEAEPGAAVLTHKTLAYRFGRSCCVLVYRTLLRARVHGAEHLPVRGAALIAANHQSYLDIPLVAMATRRHVSFVARDSLAESRALGWLMRQCGTVLVRRGQADRAAVREMAAHLAAGDLVSVFPEGTRSTDRSLGEFRGGAMLAARLAGVPIVPAGIRGTFDAWPKGGRPRPAPISIAFGAPIDPRAPGANELVHASVLALVGDGRELR